MSDSPILYVHILGNGKAAANHRAAYAELSHLYQEVERYEAADIIDICTPSYLHYSQAICAVSSGVHAFVEKPVCASLQELDDLMFLEAKSEGRIMPIMQHRFSEGRADTKYRLGFKRDKEYYSKSKWRGKWATELGGVLTTQAIHMADLMARDFDITSVSSMMTTGYPYPEEVEVDTCTGFTAITKTGDSLFFHALNYWMDLPPFQGTHQDAFKDGHKGLVSQLRLAHTALTKNTRLPVTTGDMSHTIELLTAVYKSVCVADVVELPIDPADDFYQGWQKQMKDFHARWVEKNRSKAVY